MQNFLFSLNATMPVFLIILLGWILRKVNVVNDRFATDLNKLTFHVLFPLLLFRDIAECDLKQCFNPRFMIYCFVTTIVSFLVVWGLSEICIKDKRVIGTFTMCSFRGSAAVLGVAFVLNMYEHAGMVPLMIICSVPLYNIFSVILLTFRGVKPIDGGKNGIRKAFVNIITNPLIIGIVLGIPFAIYQISFPIILSKGINSLCSVATSLALLMVGAGFDTKQAIAKRKLVAISSSIKLVILPLIFIPIAVKLGFREEALIAILIMLGAPTTVSTYIMSKAMNGDDVLSSGVVVVTTLFSAITITGIIFLLRILHYV